MLYTTVLIKNMVCHRCVLAVEGILHSEAIPFNKVVFGEMQLYNALTQDQKERLVNRFKSIGFELIDNRIAALTESIKKLVIRRARNEGSEAENKRKLSYEIAASTNHEYTYLSSLFSSIEGRTIENYFIEQHIEKAKELLVYGQMTLSQIAFDLEYSSVAHLSNQFKKITGLTPTYFKAIGVAKRRSLDQV